MNPINHLSREAAVTMSASVMIIHWNTPFKFILGLPPLITFSGMFFFFNLYIHKFKEADVLGDAEKIP